MKTTGLPQECTPATGTAGTGGTSLGKRKAGKGYSLDEFFAEIGKRAKTRGEDAVSKVKEALDNEFHMEGTHADLSQAYKELQEEYSKLKAASNYEEAQQIQELFFGARKRMALADSIHLATEHAQREKSRCCKHDKLKEAMEWRDFPLSLKNIWPQLATYNEALRLSETQEETKEEEEATEDEKSEEEESEELPAAAAAAPAAASVPDLDAAEMLLQHAQEPIHASEEIIIKEDRESIVRRRGGKVSKIGFDRFMQSGNITLKVKATKFRPAQQLTFNPKDECFVHDTENGTIVCKACEKSFVLMKAAKAHVLTEVHQEYKRAHHKRQEHELEIILLSFEKAEMATGVALDAIDNVKQKLSDFFTKFKVTSERTRISE